MYHAARQDPSPAMITPGRLINDEHAAYWFAQVNLRLRREVAWCWFQRMNQPMVEGVIPPVTDATAENLDMVRFAEQKMQFFAADPACVFLSEQINNLHQPTSQSGRWSWLVSELGLNDAEQFVLALGLSMQVDAGLAPIFATCLNDLNKPYPTLALAQRLWQEPQQIIPCADSEHRLFHYGLLSTQRHTDNTWWAPLIMPSIVAQQLVDKSAKLPPGLSIPKGGTKQFKGESLNILLGILGRKRLKNTTSPMQIVPLIGPRGSAFEDWACAISTHSKRQVLKIEQSALADPKLINALACICWLQEADPLLPANWGEQDRFKEVANMVCDIHGLPLVWYIPFHGSEQKQHFVGDYLLPDFHIKGLSFEQRVDAFKQQLSPGFEGADYCIEDCARRFRFEERTIEKVASVFGENGSKLNPQNLLSVCSEQASFEMGNLAQLVQPRFSANELILPRSQSQQIDDILHAMAALTTVHYHWGTAKVWNESGLSVLFCGTPGTGKTMAAEAISTELRLPMYRIDLSQVVNKYIGETEKNLKRIFDAAELSDCILFFDEADALFGKRTDVKDAHDRFANIEISYLLERMERFKGLAILATNRRKDLDEAFMRRLRYVVEFPVPGFEQRYRIWLQVFPEHVNTSDLDFRYLAKQFQLCGGHIRSAVFNACLRAANGKNPQAPARIGMQDLLIAIKRELEKINRSASDELFGAYAHLLGPES